MRPHMQMKFSTPKELSHSYEAKNSCWSRASKIKALVYSTSFIYNGKGYERGSLCLLTRKSDARPVRLHQNRTLYEQRERDGPRTQASS